LKLRAIPGNILALIPTGQARIFMLEYHQTPLNQSINPMQVITHITHHPSSIAQSQNT
jgi:hypothetical protein